jgi:hypothetical protein
MTNDDETKPSERTDPLDGVLDATTPLGAPAGAGAPAAAGAPADPPSGAPAASPASAPAGGASAAVPRPRRTARFGTIFRGVVLLVFALAVAVTALPWFSVDPVTLLLTACIAAGVLLVVAGVAAVVARGRG